MKGIREDLSNLISDISPEETITLSAIGTGKKMTNTLAEWQTDELETPDGTNAVAEGDEASYDTPDPTVRVGNYSQISRKTLSISGTADAVNAAGRKSEMARQITKKGISLKRDQETILLRAQAGDSGGDDGIRRLAAFNAWLKTNVDKASDGANPTYTSGVPDAVRTGGTNRAFTETILKSVLQKCWTNGAKVSTLMMGPINKQKASGFSGTVTQNYNLSNVAPRATAIIAAVDIYVGDLGTVRMIPNRLQREEDAWFMDWSMARVRYLRPYQIKKMGPNGDAMKRLMLAEWTLEVDNEAAFGLAADLTTTA
jgi:hypothetical protein